MVALGTKHHPILDAPGDWAQYKLGLNGYLETFELSFPHSPS